MYRDATKEFKPFERSENPSGRHPRPRIGATAKKRNRIANRRVEEPVKTAPAPAKRKK